MLLVEKVYDYSFGDNNEYGVSNYDCDLGGDGLICCVKK